MALGLGSLRQLLVIDLCHIFLPVDLSVTSGRDSLGPAEKATEVQGIVISDDRRYVADRIICGLQKCLSISNPGLKYIRGFVWEWCDHAVYKGTAENGKAMYWYGGDHGELQHDGNFCLDGLVYPHRRPHTGLLEYKNVHRPLRATYDFDRQVLTVENHMDFTDPAGRISAAWTEPCIPAHHLAQNWAAGLEPRWRAGF